MKKKELNILVVTQYFWPENMRINDLVEGFVEKGHKVTVLTGIPNYPEGKIFSSYKKSRQEFSEYRGAKIIRVPMLARGKKSISLILNYLSFFISASTTGLFKLRNQQFDAIFVYAVSPITAAIPAVIIGRFKKTPIFLWVLDLWPETLSAVGVVKNAFILRTVERLVSWIYNRVDYILLPSKSFQENVLNYCTRTIDSNRLIYFPSWVEQLLLNYKDVSVSKVLTRDDSLFTVMFTGNIGESQDFPAILNVFEKLKGYVAIRLVIVGGGRMFQWVNDEVFARKLTNVLLLGRHPVSEMPGLISCADALLVSLKKNEVFSKTIPGKLQGYLAAGKPILGMVNGESANIILESRAGLVCASGDVNGLVDNICKLAGVSSAGRDLMGRNGVDFYNRHFQSEQLFSQLESLFQIATRRSDAHNGE